MKNKFNARAVTIDGHRFPSQAEATRYQELCLMQKADKINSLELQPKFHFEFGVTYVADFRYWDNKECRFITEDVKGVSTPVFKLKLKAFHHYFKGARLLINGVNSLVKKTRKKRSAK